MHKIFGKKEDVEYTTRIGAYFIPIKDNKIGVIQTPKGYFLIGGGKEKNETNEDCLKRECLEEIGYDIKIDSKICSAEMYTLHEKIGYFHPVQTYYSGILKEQIKIPIEKDHILVWLSFEEIQNNMYVEMQNWAIEQYIKGLE